MADSLISDATLNASKIALDGLALRQQAISRNLANVDTPGYQAKTVDFKQAISNALSTGQGLGMTTTSRGHLASARSSTSALMVSRPGGTERADQNNVDIDTELLDMSQTAITYNAISQEVSKKLLLLKAIASGS